MAHDAQLKAAQTGKEKAAQSQDSISRMAEEDMRQLQQLMEKKSQLENEISNTMKASSDSEGSLPANTRGS